MKLRRLAAVSAGMTLLAAGMTWGQAPAGSSDSTGRTTARVETAPISLLSPERYQVPVVFEPIQRIAMMAPDDGLVRLIPVPVGATVRENQELVQLDRAEAAANLKIAEAEVKEREATLKANTNAGYGTIYEAQLEAARAKAELAKAALDRCSLHAPFAGRVLAFSVSPGQYVVKGTNLGDLADVSRLKVLVPVDRGAVKEGQTLKLTCEGKTVSGKVETLLPLHEGFAVLRELAIPWSAAWVTVENPDKLDLEPGLRVHSPYLPDAPIAAVSNRAVKNPTARNAIVQVIRNEHVKDVPVTVLGNAGLDRTQVAGEFRPTDILIVESSIPLTAGTFIRFGRDARFGEGADATIEGTAPNPNATGSVADIGPQGGAPASRVAPIGAPNSNVPRSAPPTTTRTAPPTRTTRPAAPTTRPAPRPAAPPPSRRPRGRCRSELSWGRPLARTRRRKGTPREMVGG